MQTGRHISTLVYTNTNSPNIPIFSGATGPDHKICNSGNFSEAKNGFTNVTSLISMVSFDKPLESSHSHKSLRSLLFNNVS